MQVQAADNDSGPNGHIEYGFSPQTTAMLGHLFGIRESSGDVFVKGSIDHEKSSVYQLVVVARDHGPESFSSESTILIHVEDINDNAPQVGQFGETSVPAASNGRQISVDLELI